MAPVPRGMKGAPFDIGEEWMNRAVAQFTQGQEEEYLPPVHVNHHFSGKPTELAGRLRLTDVRPTRYRGQIVPVLFADLLRIPEKVFRRIENGEIVYSSPEVSNWQEATLRSLALMDDEAPHFKLPLITVGRKDAATAAMSDTRETAPLVFCFREFGDHAMPDTMAPAAPPIAPAGAGAPGAAPAEEQAPKWWGAAMADMKKMFADALAAKYADKKDDDNMGKPPAVEPDDLKEEEKEKEAAGMSAEIAARFAAQEGELAALRAAEKERKKGDARKTRIEKAKADLREYHLDAATQASLAKFADLGDEPLAMFVAEFKRNVPIDPPETLAQFSGRSVEAPEIAKFSDRGPEALAQARRLFPQFDLLRKKGVMRVSFEEYVNSQAPAFTPIE